jgi:hypothetical protein
VSLVAAEDLAVQRQQQQRRDGERDDRDDDGDLAGRRWRMLGPAHPGS